VETGESESKEKEDRNKRKVRQSVCESNGIAHVGPKKSKKEQSRLMTEFAILWN